MFLATLLLVVGFASASPAAAGTAEDEQLFIQLINQTRAQAGLPPLTVQSELTREARSWASSMAASDTLAHAPNIASGIAAPWIVLGENVGVHGVENVQQLHDAFVASPGHYKNIVDPRFRYIGVGVVITAEGKLWTTHRFMATAEPTASTSPPTTAPPTTAPPTTAAPATAPPITAPPATAPPATAPRTTAAPRTTQTTRSPTTARTPTTTRTTATPPPTTALAAADTNSAAASQGSTTTSAPPTIRHADGTGNADMTGNVDMTGNADMTGDADETGHADRARDEDATGDQAGPGEPDLATVERMLIDLIEAGL